MKVTIWHNVQEDAAGRHTGMLDGYQASDCMAKVFQFAIPSYSAGPLLEDVFREFNIGEDLLAQAYRRNQLRSLSVGDVVGIRENDADPPALYACASTGWTRLPDDHRLNDFDA